MLLILNVVLFISFGALAQNSPGIELKNYKTQNSRFIKDGTEVKVIQDGKKYKGILRVISAQEITVHSDTLLLSQIQEISAKTTSRMVGGIALTTASTIVGGAGATAIISGDFGIIFGTPLLAVGVLGVYKGVSLIKGKNFNSSRWQYRVADTVSVIDPK